MKKLICLLVVLASCKAGVRESEKSDPDYALSEDGRLLTVTLGCDSGKWDSEKGQCNSRQFTGYCLSVMRDNDSSEMELLTTRGGLEEKQLKKSLRYMSFTDHIFSGLLIEVAAGVAGAAVVAGAAPVALALIPVAGGIAYRVIRGKQEGEGGGAITGRSLGGGIAAPVTGPIIEIYGRKGRARKLISEKETLNISNKKMDNVVERIREMFPKYYNTCNHLK